MYYVIQENLFREYGFKALQEHLERNNIGYEIVKYIPFSKQLDAVTDRKDVFFFGSSNAGTVAKEKYNWTPGHFINDNFSFTNYLREYKEHLLNRDGKVIGIMEDVAENYFFVRPDTDTKEFTGYVTSIYEWNAYIKEAGDAIDKNLKIFVSSIKHNIQQEIRCWIVDGEPVTISQYKIGRRVNYLNMDNNEEAVLFARKMAKIYQPARAFCLDICLCEDEYKIVELGCINHCGFYDANMSKLIQAIENMTFVGNP